VLDLILSNAPKCYTATNHQPIGSSDHQIITTTPSNKTYKQLTKAKSMKLTNKNGNTAAIVDHISHIDWDETINANISPQQKTDVFYQTIQDIIATQHPRRTKTITDKDQPWMTDKKTHPQKTNAIQAEQRRMENNCMPNKKTNNKS
jgi:hypothetical protein